MHKHLLSNFKITFKLPIRNFTFVRQIGQNKIKVSERKIITQIPDFRDDYINLYIIKYTQLKAFKGRSNAQILHKQFLINLNGFLAPNMFKN